VVDEARKGFDLLVVGMDKVGGATDGFDKKLEAVTAGFEARWRSSRRKALISSSRWTRPFKILVPVSGSAVSRRGAEIAIALAGMAPRRCG